MSCCPQSQQELGGVGCNGANVVITPSCECYLCSPPAPPPMQVGSGTPLEAGKTLLLPLSTPRVVCVQVSP